MTKAAVAKAWTYHEWADGISRPYEEPEGDIPPSWATALTVDTWAALSTVNNFDDVQASDGGQYGTLGPDAVFTAWNGAALVDFGTKGSVLHWGGGHTDYHGNEVYCFDLASLTWSRLNDPSTAGNADGWNGPYTNGILSDGTPNASHTYYAICGRGSELVIGRRDVEDTPTPTWMVSIFDATTEEWTNSTRSTGLGLTNNDGIVYDSTRDLIWFVEADFLGWASYDPDTDAAMNTYTEPTGAYSPAGLVYVPTKDLVILFTTGEICVALDPDNPTSDKVELSTSGTAPSMSPGDQARWSSNLGAVVYYPNQGDDIYLLTPPETTGDWVWTQRSLTGNSGAHDGQGTYGKFNVAEWGETTVALVTGDVDGPYRAVRLS